MAIKRFLAIAMVCIGLVAVTTAQLASLQSCGCANEDTRCLIDLISQKMSEEHDFVSQKMTEVEDVISQKMSEVQNFFSQEMSQHSCRTPMPCYLVPIPRDCKQVKELGSHVSKVYSIYPTASNEEAVDVYCDMDTDGGGWTVFQRRQDGSVNFTRVWNDYRDGFGNLLGEHWLGNKYVHAMTNASPHEMRVELGDWDGNRVYAKYGQFRVGPEEDGYRLDVDSFSGTARGDSLTYGGASNRENQNGHKFSTIDKDQDGSSVNDCAGRHESGFWFNNCLAANLNHPYTFSQSVDAYQSGITWFHFKGDRYSLKFAEMKIRAL